MNIVEQLNQKTSRANANRIESEVVNEKGKLIELMACFLGGEPKIVERAAMVLGSVGRHHPHLLRPWCDDLVDLLETSSCHAVRRNLTRYFSETTFVLPKQLEARLISRCSGYVADPNEKAATVVFAMQFVANHALRYPQQASKLKQDLISRLPTSSAAIKSRGKKILKQLESIDFSQP